VNLRAIQSQKNKASQFKVLGTPERRQTVKIEEALQTFGFTLRRVFIPHGAKARRIFADNGWPVIDVTRRSIEESALGIVKLYTERLEAPAE